MTTPAQTLAQFVQEQHLARRLGLTGVFDAGVTTSDQRRLAIRHAIITAKLEGHRIVRSKSVTFAQAFERTYQEPINSGEPINHGQ